MMKSNRPQNRPDVRVEKYCSFYEATEVFVFVIQTFLFNSTHDFTSAVDSKCAHIPLFEANPKNCLFSSKICFWGGSKICAFYRKGFLLEKMFLLFHCVPQVVSNNSS